MHVGSLCTMCMRMATGEAAAAICCDETPIPSPQSTKDAARCPVHAAAAAMPHAPEIATWTRGVGPLGSAHDCCVVCSWKPDPQRSRRALRVSQSLARAWLVHVLRAERVILELTMDTPRLPSRVSVVRSLLPDGQDCTCGPRCLDAKTRRCVRVTRIHTVATYCHVRIYVHMSWISRLRKSADTVL